MYNPSPTNILFERQTDVFLSANGDFIVNFVYQYPDTHSKIAYPNFVSKIQYPNYLFGMGYVILGYQDRVLECSSCKMNWCK
jgi:hypothetical protein